ncbi:hypothetical protein [Arthrobacter glacialis]|uniref:Uncharacterized protein n=1 Tax=Arthrobacter glacialis TaxID=1664 RepID=A0A2S4A0E7_ARTGL|nr:hypothetical protein [Arthrobacter glacialis]POH60747.1 hypothetical protein CVS28_03530 [Arthrobacter glacialis]POH74824.1 hypothetical protein CVS27_02860 [Arthrobacter glacialis]
MDYEIVELLVGGVLALLPIVAVVVVGLWCMKQPQRRMPWFFFLGPAASVAYIWIAAYLAMAVFQPPVDPAFAGGRGLDLSGFWIIGGSMVGGIAGVLTSMLLCAANLLRQYGRHATDAP